MIAAILLTIIYVAYILLWFIGCCFVTFAFLEKTTYRENHKTEFMDVVLFVSIVALCFSGLGRYLTVFDAIDKIKNLW